MKIVRILKLMLLCLAVAVVTGCGDSRYDSRLLAADSLINARPDSALTLLSGIAPGEMAGSADRAYFSLLITQAKYKCDRTIKSTDTIDVAIVHFADNHDREKYTRSLIYKGAVLDELGDKTEAMLWYKRAEENADTADCFNLGYVNMRMAQIYRDAYAGNELDVGRYKRALHYFELAGDSIYQMKCLSNIGAQYRITNMDSAYKYIGLYINHALRLKSHADIYNGHELLARAYIFSHRYADGRDEALKALSIGGECITDEVYHDLCQAYSRLGMCDSAEYYLGRITPPTGIAGKYNLNKSLSELYNSAGDYKSAIKHQQIADMIADSADRANPSPGIIKVEDMYDNQLLLQDRLTHKENEFRLTLYISLLTVVIMLLAAFAMWKHRSNLYLCDSIRLLHEDLEAARRDLSCRFENQDRLYSTFQNHIDMIKGLLDSFFQNEKNHQKFVSDFRNAVKVTGLTSDFWRDLQSYTDSRYNNIVTDIREQHAELSDDDVKFITLLILGFSYTEISICMGYANSKAISTRKIRIAAKIGVGNLSQFIENVLAEHTKKSVI